MKPQKRTGWPWPLGLWALLASVMCILATLAITGAEGADWVALLLLCCGLLLVVLAAWILGHMQREGVSKWRKK